MIVIKGLSDAARRTVLRHLFRIVACTSFLFFAILWLRSFFVGDSIGLQYAGINDSGVVFVSARIRSEKQEFIGSFSSQYTGLQTSHARYPGHCQFNWGHYPVGSSVSYPPGLYHPTTLVGQLGFGCLEHVDHIGVAYVHRHFAFMLPQVAVLAVFALIPCRWLFRYRRSRARRQRHCCESCGYSLIGNASGVCPECGHARAWV